ncbi:hypothetical protein [Streptomyces sp. NPDC006739]|uniref:hypothetical protein n=1 Tax=Streptomyces sp. NPDC006739 TaxID=3364763 RepID=UPI0036D18A5F
MSTDADPHTSSVLELVLTAVPSATLLGARPFEAAAGSVAIVAPCPGRALVESFARHGWRSVVVEPGAARQPSVLQERFAAGAHADVVEHRGSLRRTVKALRALGVSAVVSGSAAGVELTERIAWQLGLPRADPETSRLRYDRGAQAAALHRAALPAPRGIATTSLTEALAWAGTHPLPGYVLAPAAAGVPVEPVVCDGPAWIGSAWPAMVRAAARHGGDTRLLLTERLSARRFVVNSVSRPGADGRTDHAITDVWAERRAWDGTLDRTDLLHPQEPLTRELSAYMLRVLDTLGVMCGPVTARLAREENRGPLLVSALAVPGTSPADEALRRATGCDRVTDALDTWNPRPPVPFLRTPTGHRIVRVHLHPSSGAASNPALGAVLRRLPTVSAAGEDPPAGCGSPFAEVVLSGADPDAVEADYRAIRAVERAGLHEPVRV